jgi:UDP:flavonoid glycosyltransferase YjiC (YdhE family)
MKLTTLALLTVSLFSTLTTFSAAKGTASPATKGMPEDLNVRKKHVVFCATFGGPSHIKPMLGYGAELAKRGHTVTLATNDDLQPYADPHGFNKYSLGPKKLNETWENTNIQAMAAGNYGQVDVLAPMMETQKMYYPDTHKALEKLFEGKTDKGKVDVVICDFFVFPCMDLATKHKVPYIVATHTVGVFGMSLYLGIGSDR